MSSARILIVEDEGIIARSIEKRLREMGYSLAGSAATGEEAIRLAVETIPDLVLMDISLAGGMDGIAAAREIRRQVDVPVVYLTAFSDPATLERARITEPLGYVLKPFEDRDLQTAIEMGLYRHQIDRRLRESERWLAATLGSMGDGVIATDENGCVRFMNSVAEVLTGWTQPEAQGREVQSVFPMQGADGRPGASPAQKALSAGLPTDRLSGALLATRRGGELPIDGGAAPITDASGAIVGAVLVFRDASERLRLEEHVRQAHKMEAVGRLAGGIAHEFNNILTVILGVSELMLIRAPANEDEGPGLEAIRDAALRAASLTRQIVAFGGQQLLIPARLELNELVAEMAGVVRRVVGPEIQVVTDLAPGMEAVTADSAQLGQILLHLAENARGAMPAGGSLVLATTQVRLDATAAERFPDLSPGQYAVLSVTDTGTGMSEEVAARAFEPFFTTREVGEGAGLGLAAVYGIVRQSGGHVELQSAPGEGTCIRVYLPSAGDPAESVVSAAPAARGTEARTVLLVEPDEAVRRMVSTVLTRAGYGVLEAADGDTAAAVGESHEGPIHLLMADAGVAGPSGLEVVRRLREERSELRVLLMVGSADEGAFGEEVIRKPFSLAALTGKLAQVLR